MAVSVQRYSCSASALSRRVNTPLAKYSLVRSLAKIASWNASSSRSTVRPSRFSAISRSSGCGSSPSVGGTGSTWLSTSITLTSSSEWCAVSARPDSEMRCGIGSSCSRQAVPMVYTTSLAYSRMV